MRKIALILCVVLLLGMFGCSGDAPKNTEGQQATDTTGAAGTATGTFSAGYARECVTPSGSVGLAGYGNDSERGSLGVMDDLYVTCVAVSDAEGNTVLFYTVDFLSVDKTYTSTIQNAVNKETGIPQENIFFAATHNHSAPSCVEGNMSATVKKAAVKTAVEALADRSAAKMEIASIETEKMNHVRHYLTDKGTYVGDNYGIHSGVTVIEHETEADRELQLIKFTRDEGKAIVMVNFQAHPNMTGKYQMVTADYIGACRTEFEKKSDCLFAYFQGAGGNLNPTSYVAEENFSSNSDHIAHGKELARYAISAMNNNAQSLEPGVIKIAAEKYTAKVRKDSVEATKAAVLFTNEFAASQNREKALIASGGLINSNYTITAMARRARAGESREMEAQAISIGELSFIVAPYEMFDTNAMFVKENSPFQMTFVLGYCNGMYDYIPSEIAYSHGCYEMDHGYFVSGTGEDLADVYVKLLKDMHG